MKKLVIAEKPELGVAIAQALIGHTKEKHGTFENDEYVITWAYGHLLNLAEPEDYDEKYKNKSDISLLPIAFPNWKKTTYKDKEKAYATNRLHLIGKLLKNVQEVIHCGDPDEEGQLLIDEILEHYHFKGTVKRVLINDNLPNNIRKAFEQMEDNQKFQSMGRMAYARQMADKCFGINHSRLASYRLHKPLSIGRVQTPTLALVVNRDIAIKNHQKQTYFTLEVEFQIQNQALCFSYKQNKEETKILNKDVFLPILEEIQKQNVFQFDFKVEEKILTPPLPYNATELQADMNGRYGYSLSETMKITQELREKYKAITYNRSDCQYLKMEHFKNAKSLLPLVFKNISTNFPVDYTIQSKCFNDEKVSAHHGIVPQAIPIHLATMSEKQKNVYIAICERYIMQFLPPLRKKIHSCQYPLKQGVLSYEDSVVLDKGFIAYFDYLKIKENNQNLPQGTHKGVFKQYFINEKQTKPLQAYTPKTLIKDMSSISKYVTNDALKKVLKDKDKGKVGEHGSIGTVATRAIVVDNLIKKGFLEMDGKKILSTKLGQEFCSLIPEEIKSAETTAKWWMLLQEVKDNNKNPNIVMESVVKQFQETKDNSYKGTLSHTQTFSREIGCCLKCGKNVLKTKSKKTLKNVYYCEGFRDKTCDFVLNEDFKRFNDTIHLTEAKVIKLLNGGTISEELTNKDGKAYQALLKLEIDGKYVQLKIAGFSRKKKQ
ncbi:DNA topoisomerase [Bulleidia sp. zg-1006]|uniref:DNA topoisomerase n=1 Tax=Bulleidia sp. zg-1006 TaxID=2806552 RepID=UPI0019394381|nr:DNA topoisomerase [Bulleidia sp. zg-1006]QRG86047.1 DNA topoisomerase III [Bulleidia sp. zg-1006]